MATVEEFQRFFGALRALFPAGEFTEQSQLAYMALLQPYDGDDLLRAVIALGTTRQNSFVPPVAELITAIGALGQERLPGFDEALVEVRGEIRRVGSYGTPSFSHPCIAQAVAAIGWRELCLSEEPQIIFAQLRMMYQSAIQRVTETRAALAANGPAARLLTGLADKMRALPQERR